MNLFPNWPTHCMKSFQIRSYFRPVFLCIRIHENTNTRKYSQSKYTKMRTRKNSVFGHSLRSDHLSNPWNMSESPGFFPKYNSLIFIMYLLKIRFGGRHLKSICCKLYFISSEAVLLILCLLSVVPFFLRYHRS